MNLADGIYKTHTSARLSHINVGLGSDITIAQLAHQIGQVVGYQGSIAFDASKPDGPPRKWMSSELINQLGWRPRFDLNAGLQLAYANFLERNL